MRLEGRSCRAANTAQKSRSGKGITRRRLTAAKCKIDYNRRQTGATPSVTSPQPPNFR